MYKFIKNILISFLLTFIISHLQVYSQDDGQQKNKISQKNLILYQIKKLYKTELYKSFYIFLNKKGIEDYYIPRLFCIAKLESNLDPYAINFNRNGTFDIGLLQINSLWQKICGAKLHEIETNISCANIVLKKQGLSAWVSYRKWGNLCEKSLRI